MPTNHPDTSPTERKRRQSPQLTHLAYTAELAAGALPDEWER